MAGSMPVVLASDQTPVPVSVAAFPAPIDVSDRAGRILGHVVVDASALPVGAATEATLADAEADLDTIASATNVPLSSLATQVTAASILGQLDVLLSSRLAEATFTSRINTLGQKAMAASTPVVIASDQSSIAVTATIPGTVDVSDRAGRLVGHVTVDASVLPAGAATEATLADAEADLDVIAAATDVPLSTLATEATAALIRAKTDNLDVLLSTRASQTTLASVLAQLDVALSTRASQATVASILAQLDVALSTRASEATLALIKTKTDNLDVLLSTRASQTTLASVLAQLDVALSTRAAATTQTDGTQKSIVRGGAKGTTVAADVTSTAEGGNNQALDVQIYHGGVAKDPTQIRALTNADVVTAEISKWIGSAAPTVGQKAMASSIPVVIASDQSSIAVTATISGTVDVSDRAGRLLGHVTVDSSALPTGAATEATLAEIGADIDTIETNFDVALSTRASQTTLASVLGQLDVLLSSRAAEHTTAASPHSVRLSDGTAFYDGTKTGQLPSALVGGRLDVNAGAWLGSTAPSVGQKASASSLPVVIASDQSSVPVTAAQGTKGAAANAWPVVSYDSAGNEISSSVSGTPVSGDRGLVTRPIEGTYPTYWATYSRITPAANKYVATLFNTSASRKVVIQRIWVYNWQLAAAAGVLTELEMRRITARTAGTSITPAPLDLNDTLSAGITADHASTVVTDSTLLQLIVTSTDTTANTSSAIIRDGRALSINALVYERKPGERGIVLRQNQGLTLKNITAIALGSISTVIEFTDEVA